MISRYQDLKAIAFTDSGKFVASSKERQKEKERFISGANFDAKPKYPKLDFLYDIDKNKPSGRRSLNEIKSRAWESILYLDAAQEEMERKAAEYELFAKRVQKSLGKIILVEAANNLRKRNSEVNRRAFNEVNKDVYGAMQPKYFWGLVQSEKRRIKALRPKNEEAKQYRDELLSLGMFKTTDTKLGEVFNDEDLARKMRKVILALDGTMLSAIPETNEDVKYTAKQAARILNKALAAGGYSAIGWKVVVRDEAFGPSVSSVGGRVFKLPADFSRTAKEIRRLAVHEIGVHIARAENGLKNGGELLARGTAECTPAEEGLAVLKECAIEGTFDNASFNRAKDRYLVAGLALGLDGTKRDAQEVFGILYKIIAVRNTKEGAVDEEVVTQAKDEAYKHVENAYRGTTWDMRGVIYSRLKVYYEGLVKNIKYFRSNLDSLTRAMERAMVGKYDHTDANESNLVAAVTGKKEVMLK